MRSSSRASSGMGVSRDSRYDDDAASEAGSSFKTALLDLPDGARVTGTLVGGDFLYVDALGNRWQRQHRHTGNAVTEHADRSGVRQQEGQPLVRQFGIKRFHDVGRLDHLGQHRLHPRPIV